MEEKVWQFILGFESDNGYVPSLYQISEQFGWRQKSAAKHWVDKLIAQKKLRRLKEPLFIYYELI